MCVHGLLKVNLELNACLVKFFIVILVLGRHSAEDTASRKRIHKEDKRYEALWKLL